MSSGHDVSEYELVSSGLPPMFHHNNRGKIDENPRKIFRIFFFWYGPMTPPEDRVISMFTGLLTNHDRTHSLHGVLNFYKKNDLYQKHEGHVGDTLL
jgi:hypothetical protein